MSKPTTPNTPTLILFNKPYGVLSQFRSDDNNDFATLSDYFSDKRLRVAGRLDATSEGLLLLTDDGQLNKALTHPPKANAGKKQGKTYWVQVEGNASAQQLQQLRAGLPLKDGPTLPANVEILPPDTANQLWPVADNIAKRAVTTWLAITIVEGRNRQVRRMTAHVGLPCLRLIRMASSGFALGDLGVGEQRRIQLNDNDLQRLGVVPAVRHTQPKHSGKKPGYTGYTTDKPKLTAHSNRNLAKSTPPAKKMPP